MVVEDLTTLESIQFILDGQQIPTRTEARYIGVKVTARGFKKTVDGELKQKSNAACIATSGKDFFDVDLPNSTIRTLYKENIKSILGYGCMLLTDISELKKLDRKNLKQYFKKLLHLGKLLPEKLLNRLALRLRLSSFGMDVEKMHVCGPQDCTNLYEKDPTARPETTRVAHSKR